MRRNALIAALKAVREDTEQALRGLTDAQLEAPGAVGQWSVKDLLAHLTAWEVNVLTNLGKARRGVRPALLNLSEGAVDAQNAKWQAEMANRPLDQVLEDFRGARSQMLRQVEGLSDEDLAAAPAWLGVPLGDYIASDSYEHEAEHLSQIKDWRVRLAGSQ